MKAIVSLFLSTWLAFEPMASAAAAKTNRLTLLEQGIRDTGFASREVPLAEFVSRYGHTMPPAMREAAFEILKEEPNYKLPKYSVQRTKTGLQISFAAEGSSGVMNLSETDNDVTTQIGKEKIRFADWMSAKTFMGKIASGFDSKSNPKWVKEPNKSPRFALISAKTLKGMDQKDREAYLTKVRNYFEAMEKAQNKLFLPQGKKSAGLFHAMIQEAFAESAASYNELRGKPCIAGGRLTEWKAFGGKNITCGGEDVIGSCRQSSGGRTILCNDAIYGSTSVAPKACVPHQTATRDCNQMISVPDSFKSAADYKAYDDFARDKALKLQEADLLIRQACEGGSGSIGPARLRGDQTSACQEFGQRRDEIAAFDCSADSFKQKYPKLTCEGGGAAPATGNDQDQNQDQDRTGENEKGGADKSPGQDGIRCDQIGLPFVPPGMEEECAPDQIEQTCIDDKGKETVRTVKKCSCPNPYIDGNVVKCPGSKEAKVSKKGSFGKWWKKNSKWVAMLVGGGIMLWAYNYMHKKSVERNYELNIPVTTTLPAAPPPPSNPQPPVPRDGTI